MLEKPNWLADELGVDFVAQISDSVVTHGLNEPITKKFGNRLDNKHNQKRNRNDGPDVMNPRRKEMIQINGFVNEGYSEKRKR